MVSGSREFRFSALLATWSAGAPLYAIEVPEGVSRAVGQRMPVPIVATLNEVEELHASLVPIGRGRHRVQLNGQVRAALGIVPGDRVRVRLWCPKRWRPFRCPLT